MTLSRSNHSPSSFKHHVNYLDVTSTYTSVSIMEEERRDEDEGKNNDEEEHVGSEEETNHNNENNVVRGMERRGEEEEETIDERGEINEQKVRDEKVKQVDETKVEKEKEETNEYDDVEREEKQGEDEEKIQLSEGRGKADEDEHVVGERETILISGSEMKRRMDGTKCSNDDRGREIGPNNDSNRIKEGEKGSQEGRVKGERHERVQEGEERRARNKGITIQWKTMSDERMKKEQGEIMEEESSTISSYRNQEQEKQEEKDEEKGEQENLYDGGERNGKQSIQEDESEGKTRQLDLLFHVDSSKSSRTSSSGNLNTNPNHTHEHFNQNHMNQNNDHDDLSLFRPNGFLPSFTHPSLSSLSSSFHHHIHDSVANVNSNNHDPSEIQPSHLTLSMLSHPFSAPSQEPLALSSPVSSSNLVSSFNNLVSSSKVLMNRKHQISKTIQRNQVDNKLGTNNSNNSSSYIHVIKTTIGSKVKLPCNISFVQDDSIQLILWFKSPDGTGPPIYSLDARGNSLESASSSYPGYSSFSGSFPTATSINGSFVLNQATHFIHKTYKDRLYFNISFPNGSSSSPNPGSSSSSLLPSPPATMVYRGIPSSDLIIDPVQESDTSEYSCRVSSD